MQTPVSHFTDSIVGRLRPLTLAAFAAFLATTAVRAPAQLASPRNPPQPPDESVLRELAPLLPEPRMQRSERVPIFFPPNPPPLDRPVGHGVIPPGRLAAPPELVTFVNEPFYPALGTRLYTNSLYDNQRRQLEDYRAAKVALQNELRAVLNHEREAEPAVRRQAFAALARTQTPKIAELEKTAESLRRTLISTTNSWSALREWHLGDKEKRGFSPLEIAMVMRGYAFYQNGLLPAQRRLLREITMELLSAVDDPSKADAAQPYLFFSPEPARVQLPDDLPPDVATKVAAYQSKKSQLKKQLYDAIYAYDGAAFTFLGNSLKSLANKQAPVFAALEALADEIRDGLARNPPPPKPEERSPLPPVLAQRVADILRDRAIAQRDATAKADAIIARRSDEEIRVRAAYRFTDDGMNVVVLPMRNPRSEPPKGEAEVIAKVQASLAVVAEAYGRRLTDLMNEQENIRREAAEILGDSKREKVDGALIATNRIAILKENEDAYRDYRTAVFEPGLSPEQRRLLFAMAIDRLELPLPRGEIQISARAASW